MPEFETPIILPGAPTADLHAATKLYVDDSVGGGGGGDTLIDEITLGANGDILFTGIPNTYTHLRIEFWGRSSAAGTSPASLQGRVGDSSLDTGTNYAYRSQVNIAETGAAAASAAATTSFTFLPSFMPTTGMIAGPRANAMIWFFNYADISFWRTWRIMGASFRSDAGGHSIWGVGAGSWRNTANPISRLQLGLSSGLLSGSKARLFGIS